MSMLDERHADLFEPGRLVVERRTLGGVAKRCTAPQTQRRHARDNGLLVVNLGACLAGTVLEDQDVDLAPRHAQAVTAGTGVDRDDAADLLTQLGDVEPQGAQPRVGLVLSPHMLHEPIRGKDLSRMQRQQ